MSGSDQLLFPVTLKKKKKKKKKTTTKTTTKMKTKNKKKKRCEIMVTQQVANRKRYFTYK